ncbi:MULTISPECIES: hypothetical protein [unclassified Sphingobium]|uniref:hypothetical protein n=1 Tax=unclassified Sphingobium TaxID=2611147 RepID=UPI0022EDD38E|nr:hypothetical protein [Sphingobium sp. BS19]GLI98809.1 hypothetical protein Sbs19_26270 [Sphingobium sp. BS19]
MINAFSRLGVVFAIASALGLGACDGPNETAGQAQDRASALANNSTQVGEGMNEVRGRALDRSLQAAQEVQEAKADALEKQGDQMRVNADIAADRLDAQAKKVRNGEGK